MRLPVTLAVAALATAAVPAVAVAGWSAPFVVAEPGDSEVALSPSGRMLLNGDSRAVSAQVRSGDGFGAPQHVLTIPETERLWGLQADASDRILLMTIRRHRPYQRVRIVLRDTDGTLSPARTISGKGHSASQPRLSVAPDGTAVAAWAWHDSSGWRVQAAVRKPGEAFGPAQTLSEPTPQARPWVTVAAGEGGRAAITWYVDGDDHTLRTDLVAATAGRDGTFGTPTRLDGDWGFYRVSLAVAPDGRALAAWIPTAWSLNQRVPLRVSDAAAGEAFGKARTLASGRGYVDGGDPVTALAPDGGAVVAWVKPNVTRSYNRGVVEILARPPGGRFGAGQTVSDSRRTPTGLTLSAGRDGTVALGWGDARFDLDDDTPDDDTPDDHRLRWETRVSVRAPGARAFATADRVSDPAHDSRWPIVTVTPDGGVLAAWAFIDDASGGGRGATAVRAP